MPYPKGLPRSEESKQKHKEWLKINKHPFIGKKHSEETKKRMSKSQMKRFEKNPMTKKHKEIISKLFTGRTPWNKGKTGLYNHTEEIKQRIGQVHTGRKHTDKARRNMSIGHGGSGILKTKRYFYNMEYRKIKDKIYTRDFNQCQMCGVYIPDEFSKQRHCHHIDYNAENNSPNNLVTLCAKDHCKTTVKDREPYIDYFNTLFNTYNQLEDSYLNLIGGE